MSSLHESGRSEGPKLLYLFFHHELHDPRLTYREIRSVVRALPTARVYGLTSYTLQSMDSILTSEPQATGCQEQRPLHLIYDAKRGLLKKLADACERTIRRWGMLPKVLRLRPALIQASDPRELPFALVCRLITGARVIYDAHEDYFNQLYEFGGRTTIARLRATWVAAIERLLVRLVDSVYCTDEFLFEQYSQAGYRARSVTLLRNFPPQLNIKRVARTAPSNALRLVYIGAVNEHRGVIECARYCAQYNAGKHGRKLEFSVYGVENELVRSLDERGLIVYRGHKKYECLMNELAGYDVGVCLWRRIKKFERNLPLKNFDYMAVGLPVLTSNFGNLEKYATASGAALCIDPESYQSFYEAIERLTSAGLRKQLGNSGLEYVANSASFDVEARPYVATISRLTTWFHADAG